ncbi:MAG TPA: aspartate aminotransferase family protein [Gemmatimonadaceae bacterium]|jgi:beta-alanine--pyruvate transaminase
MSSAPTVSASALDIDVADLSLEELWMPFTANRAFKRAPRLLTEAKGMYYTAVDGRRILDGTAGLWCVNAGHCREPIARAIAEQAARMDYAPGFQMGHPLEFELASRLTDILPGKLDHVFFANSGSEAVDSALKIALAYWQAKGEPTRTKLIGRLRAYHGVGFGGISVGGIDTNKKQFAGQLLPNVDHLPHTHDPARNAFSRGQPEHGKELADQLETVVQKHGASTIAAVIIEPMAGSTGVLIPPKGYLERLREICTRHGILLIFDEVITGFGRLGAPFAADYFGVEPDVMTVAKGITNAAVPMGAVFVRRGVYETIVNATEQGIEFFHGYTYSGHPLACAAALATLGVYRDEGLFERAASLAPYFEDAVHSLRVAPHVVDIRNLGVVAGIELASRPGKAGARAFEVFTRCFQDENVLIRTTGDIIALSPPLIVEEGQIDEIIDAVAKTLKRVE